MFARAFNSDAGVLMDSEMQTLGVFNVIKYVCIFGFNLRETLCFVGEKQFKKQ